MNSTEITIYFEEAKAAALKAVLAQEGSTIESKLQESLRFLYEQLVPVEQQSAIDALIIGCGRVESEAGEKEGVAEAPPSRKTADGNADRREFTAVFGAFTE